MKLKKSTIMNFHLKLSGQYNDRYKSFDHCYAFFSKLKENNSYSKNKDLACLHLGFYLASWGMYRGSSFLLQKDYTIFDQIIKELLNKKYDPLWDLEKNLNYNSIDEMTTLLLLLSNKLNEILKPFRDVQVQYAIKNKLVKNKTITKSEISETLKTKIILGTIGCIPAFDRFLKDGIGEYNKNSQTNLIKLYGFNSIKKMFEFYLEHKTQLLDIKKEIKLTYGVNHPVMKLIDIYFWQIGFEYDLEKRK